MADTIIAPDILLPDENIDLTKWAVIACDQFTGRLKYWEELESIVNNSPSALYLTLPEIFLQKDNLPVIKKINDKMRQYLSEGVFKTLKNSIILTDRKTQFNERRLGLVLAVNLDDYSFKPSDKALIRATEGTILERIPPRVKIRENAPIELSHIMLLIDDRTDLIIENLYKSKDKLEKIYDFNLNMGGGSVKGYKVEDTKALIGKLSGLLDKKLLTEKYGTEEKMLFAVGDGNHSLATAKACWENIKAGLKPEEQEKHPARFALCEVVNIHDKGLKFEPIHRLIKGVNNEKFFKEFKNYFKNGADGKIIISGKFENIKLPAESATAYSAAQDFIDKYIKESGGEVDYIHGEKDLEEICKEENAVGIVMPNLKKDELFSYIIKNGPLTRKTFSMGEAAEKRYYLEARKIIL